MHVTAAWIEIRSQRLRSLLALAMLCDHEVINLTETTQKFSDNSSPKIGEKKHRLPKTEYISFSSVVVCLYVYGSCWRLFPLAHVVLLCAGTMLCYCVLSTQAGPEQLSTGFG